MIAKVGRQEYNSTCRLLTSGSCSAVQLRLRGAFYGSAVKPTRRIDDSSNKLKSLKLMKLRHLSQLFAMLRPQAW